LGAGQESETSAAKAEIHDEAWRHDWKSCPSRPETNLQAGNGFPLALETARNSMAFRSECKTPLSARIFRQPETEDKKLRKDPFGGPCFEGTLRNRFAFRMKSRGRDN
jgi:hypothetical protein